ncbi:MAG: type III secretion system export apparatus subunit SctV [Hyphomicrobiales bacterium]
MGVLTSFLTSIRGRQDLALIGILVMTIVLMILPMPTLMIDTLIALNISFTVLILMVAIYLQRPEDFSTFPAVILIATAFRLAISISTTRMILAEADAGQIIETFGTFVTMGNVIVGLVIFLIITTVQFVVIVKGSERVAEVAARFVLDALPGRQLSIDAELRAGDITQDEARRRRRQIERENQFFGAMDGAMKFVKGDAIAGLIIIAVNLLGGIGVGTIQHGMSAGQAVDVYSRLTVGDGLVAQIPALFLALCAGAVITRVTADDKADLGTDIARQLIGDSRTLTIASIVVGAMGFIPGFPTVIFLIIGAGLAMLSFAYRRRERVAAENAAKPAAAVSDDGPAELRALSRRNEPLVLRIGADVLEAVDPETFVARRDASVEAMGEDLGFRAPRYGLFADPDIPPEAVEVDLDGVPLFTAAIPSGRIVVKADAAVLELAGIEATPLAADWPVRSAFWVDADKRAVLGELTLETMDVGELLAELGGRYLRRYAGRIMGFAEARALIEALQEEHPHLAEQVSQTVSPPKLLDVLRRLVDESVPLRPHRLLFEALAEWSLKEDDPAVLAEYARRALRRQICQVFADKNRVIAGYIIEPDFEQQLRESVQLTEAGGFLSLPSRVSDAMLAQLETIAAPADPDARPPVIVTAVDLRRYVHTYLDAHNVLIDVLSFQEIAPEFHLQPVGTLSARQGGASQIRMSSFGAAGGSRN